MSGRKSQLREQIRQAAEEEDYQLAADLKRALLDIEEKERDESLPRQELKHAIAQAVASEDFQEAANLKKQLVGLEEYEARGHVEGELVEEGEEDGLLGGKGGEGGEGGEGGGDVGEEGEEDDETDQMTNEQYEDYLDQQVRPPRTTPCTALPARPAPRPVHSHSFPTLVCDNQWDKLLDETLTDPEKRDALQPSWDRSRGDVNHKWSMLHEVSVSVTEADETHT
jgi:hypothetical protein